MTRTGWPPRGHTPRPYELSWLALALGINPTDTAALANTVDVGRRWIRRYRTWGLTATQADRWACRAGLHPLDVWPHWDLDTDDLADNTGHDPSEAA